MKKTLYQGLAHLIWGPGEVACKGLELTGHGLVKAGEATIDAGVKGQEYCRESKAEALAHADLIRQSEKLEKAKGQLENLKHSLQETDEAIAATATAAPQLAERREKIVAQVQETAAKLQEDLAALEQKRAELAGLPATNPNDPGLVPAS